MELCIRPLVKVSDLMFDELHGLQIARHVIYGHDFRFWFFAGIAEKRHDMDSFMSN